MIPAKHLSISPRVTFDDGAELERRVRIVKAHYRPEKGWLSDLPPPEPPVEHESDLLEDALAAEMYGRTA